MSHQTLPPTPNGLLSDPGFFDFGPSISIRPRDKIFKC
jgi:hypothetical protein